MGELQATVEFSVELHKFFNVDLFQRGLYQIQAQLQVSPKLVSLVEVTCGAPSPTSHPHTPTATARADGQRAYSQTFQILYRNEEVVLEDVFNFKAHVVLDANKLVDGLERAGFALLVELHFAESVSEPPTNLQLQPVSSRHLKLHFSPLRGLHYHLPVLFDYFHLAAVSVTFHAALIAVHQPYIDTPRPKPWYSSPKTAGPRNQPAFSTMETVIFGVQSGCAGTSRLGPARSVHRSVCSLLLSSFESLHSQLATVNRLLPAWQRLALTAVNCRQRLEKLSDTAKRTESEEDLMAVANSDIAQLCAELVLLWQQFLELAIRREQVRRSLARQHHNLRVRRFAEAFFTMDNPRSAATGCFDSAPQRYMDVTEALRRSSYLQNLPPLPVECAELDGEPSTTPVIYEDHYQHVSEFVRRRRQQAGRPAGTGDTRAITAALMEELRTVSTLPSAEPRSSHRGQSIEVLQRLTPSGAANGPAVDTPTSAAAAAAAAKFVSLNGLTLDEMALPSRLEPGVAAGPEEAAPAAVREPRRPPVAPPRRRTSPASDETPSSASRGGSAATPAAAVPGADSPEPKQYLKEKLKNSIRLELRLPSGPRIRGSGRTAAAVAVVGAADSDSSVPDEVVVSGRKRAGSAGSQALRGAAPSAQICASDDEASLRHSLSSISIPEAVRVVDKRRERGSLPDLAAPALTSVEVGLFGAAVPSLMHVQRGKILSQRYFPAEGDSSVGENGVADEGAGSGTDVTLVEDDVTGAGVSSQLSDPSSSGSSAADHLTCTCSAPGDDSACTLPANEAHPSAASESEGTETFRGPASAPAEPPVRPPRLSQINGRGRPARGGGNGIKARLARLGRPPSSVLPPRQFRDPPRGGSTGGESLSKSASLQFGSQTSSGGRTCSERSAGGSKSARSSGEFDGDSVYGSMSEIDGTGPAGRQHQKRLSLRVLSGAQSIGNLIARKDSRKKRRSKHELEESYRVEEGPPSVQQQQQHPQQQLLQQPQQPVCTVLEMFSEGFGTRLEDEDEPDNSTSLATSLDRKCVFTPAGSAGAPCPRPQHSREVSCDCYSALENGDQALRQRLVAAVGAKTFNFITAKEQFKEQMKGRFPGVLYSDYSGVVSSLPYFLIPDEYRLFSAAGLHLVVCVHGLDGNAADLRLVRTYLEIGLPGSNLEFIMSERNQGDTFSDFDTLTDRLAEEISYHIEAFHLQPARISFVGHSLGNIIIRNVLTRPQLAPHLNKLHTFLSLSAPHLGTLYNNSGLVNMGMWFMQKLKKSGSLLQLSMKDAPDVRDTFLYKLAMRSKLHQFRHVLLTGSSQDKYVPIHSSRIDLCKAAIRDHTQTGAAYREMVTSIIQPIVERPEVSLVRYDVHHALANNANTLIGRAAHIAALDSELFIEKFMVVAGLKYFK